MKALTAAEMREVDRLTTERFGVAGLQLMEAAGKSVAEVFLEQYGHKNADSPRRIVVLCGKGNNGGDGFVVARHLREEAEQVRVYLFAKPKELRGDAATNCKKWQEQGGAITQVEKEVDWKKAWAEISAANVIIDALLGTGIRGPATGLMARAIEDVNRLSRNATAACPAWIVAVDTPSGLPSDGEAAAGPVIRAHLTVTFTAPKIGQLISRDASCCGQLVVREIGSPVVLVEEIGKGTVRSAGPDEYADLPLTRASDAHKGSYGHVLVVAGSLGKTGAAAMAGSAALRAGAGLVTVATPDVVLPIVAAAHPEYMTEPLLSTEAGSASKRNIVEPPRTPVESAPISQEVLNSLQKQNKLPFEQIEEGKTVLAVGPGLGTHAETQEFIRSIVRSTYRPVVLDADGLNAFAGDTDDLSNRNTKFLVITPHPGEMARLLGIATKEVQADRVKTAVDAAKKWSAYVVLKGFHTVLASPTGQVFVNTTGNPGLAKGGSGDVLTGLLAGLIAQFGTEDLLRIVALGVYLHGRAADLLAEQSDPSGMLAGEVAQAIPYARQELLQELRQRA
jgi:ADP-dependent NAD(P)H-hydrate dehydratase / NAD(P)H-hydrate epimerase